MLRPQDVFTMEETYRNLLKGHVVDPQIPKARQGPDGLSLKLLLEILRQTRRGILVRDVGDLPPSGFIMFDLSSMMTSPFERLQQVGGRQNLLQYSCGNHIYYYIVDH